MITLGTPLMLSVCVMVYATVCVPCTMVVAVVSCPSIVSWFTGRPAPYALHTGVACMGNSFTWNGTLLPGVVKEFITPFERSVFDGYVMYCADSTKPEVIKVVTPGPPLLAAAGLHVSLRTGEPGQTCVELRQDAQRAALAERCTYGVVWPASAQAEPAGRALALAVQTLEGWRELWLFRR